MKSQILILTLAAALSVVAGPASAKGCLKGAAVGGVGGHVVGHHGLIGAAVGCAVGRHQANKAERAQVQQQSQRTTTAPARSS